ncbi:MAG: chromatin protein Cren7 [Thermoprotei archaeon]|nr:chromatin protein Cren7 [Thermoprotei archaeon]
MPPCTKPVKVKTPAGTEANIVPKKVWMLQPKGGKGVKIGLFQDPSTGKYFRAKVPPDYPECAS